MSIKQVIKTSSILFLLYKKAQFISTLFKKPVSGQNNKIINKGVLLHVKYDIRGSNNTLEFKRGCVLSNVTIFIRGNNHKLVISEKVLFHAGNIWFEDNNGEITIGKNTTIESAHLALTEPYSTIKIGEDCMFSNDIEVRTGDSHSIIDNESKKRINHAANVTIGDHVWVGSRAIILKGVKIGNNSIVGTASLVTGNVPESAIAAGVPAKVVKNNVNWNRERI